MVVVAPCLGSFLASKTGALQKNELNNKEESGLPRNPSAQPQTISLPKLGVPTRQ